MVSPVTDKSIIFIEAFLKMINAEVLFLGRILVETLLVIPENSLVQFKSYLNSLQIRKSSSLPSNVDQI